MPPPPPVTIVIVNWNGRALMEACLPSVLATRYPHFETLVVDNASTDGSVDWLRARHPGVKTLALPENRGFCGGNNAGIRATLSPYVVLLNNDVEVEAGWLDPLVAWMDAHPRCAAAQPKLLRHDRRDVFEYAGACGGFLDRLGYPFTRGRLFETMERDRGQYDAPRRVFWATGAALVLRRDALERVGLLDEGFFMHMEEIDLCWRLQHAGYEVWAVPQGRVYHIGGASLPQGHARKTYYNFRNNLLLLYKNLPPRAWWRLLPRRALLDGLAAARFLAGGSPAEAWAVARAYRDAHRLKGAYRARRPALSAVFPPYRRSIVLDYFGRGLRHFGDLPPDAFAPAFRAAPLEPDGQPHGGKRDEHGNAGQ